MTPSPVRLVAAAIASSIAGAVVYLLVMRLGLPALVDHLTDQQIGKLRDAWRGHPWLSIAAVAATASVLAFPVLLVFRAVSGPLAARGRRQT